MDDCEDAGIMKRRTGAARSAVYMRIWTCTQLQARKEQKEGWLRGRSDDVKMSLLERRTSCSYRLLHAFKHALVA